MRRIELAVVLGLSFALGPLTAHALQAANTARVGYLRPTSHRRASVFLDCLRQGLQERGYLDGQSIAIEAGVPTEHTIAFLTLRRS
jgi:hypothetical protein